MTKEEMQKAFEEGKTIQSNHQGIWKDYERQNQVDRPNFDYGGEGHWRVKPDIADHRKTGTFDLTSQHPDIYKQSVEMQSKLFKRGVSWHNTFADECCEDFSCCSHNATQEKQGWVKFPEGKPVIGSKPLWLFKNGDVEEIGYDGIGYRDSTHFLVLPQKPEV